VIADGPPGVRSGGATAGALRAVVRAPFSVRTVRELLFCLTGVGAAVSVIGAVLAVPLGLNVVALAVRRTPVSGGGPANPAGIGLFRFVTWVVICLAVAVILTPRIARGFGAVQRYLAARLLGETIAAPPPVRRRGWRPVGWLAAGWRDGPGWRAVAYLLVRLPVAILDGYAVFCWVVGLATMTYPLWWRLFRNHPPQVRLDPVLVLTPVGPFPVATYPGTYAAFAAGAAMVLAAPWIARVANTADRALMRGLLGPGLLAQRVRDLEETRARAVDDTAILLRRLERDLHDGAQVRLAALAMTLGRIKEKLGQGGEPVDLATARELVDAAHRSAKDALVELRNLARGIHPPVLDNGLADALATLAASSAVPVRLEADIPVRPTPAIETIAYFCAAELLANAATHSHANAVTVQASQRDGLLLLTVADDGIGGADPGRGSGLAGLAGRVRMVDGRLNIASPPGGPTRITVELPQRA
jgi:signal transduction histidine kinase